MLLKTLLKKVVDYIDANPIETGCLIVKIEAHRHDLPVEQFILTMDIRHLGVLRSLAPQAFPKKLRTGVLDIRQNIHKAWRVELKGEING